MIFEYTFIASNALIIVWTKTLTTFRIASVDIIVIIIISHFDIAMVHRKSSKGLQFCKIIELLIKGNVVWSICKNLYFL